MKCFLSLFLPTVLDFKGSCDITPWKWYRDVGQDYAVFDVDWMLCLVNSVKHKYVGQEFIASFFCGIMLYTRSFLDLWTFARLRPSQLKSQRKLARDFHVARLTKTYRTFGKGLRSVKTYDNPATDEKDIIILPGGTRVRVRAENKFSERKKTEQFHLYVVTPQVLNILKSVLIFKLESLCSCREHSFRLLTWIIISMVFLITFLHLLPGYSKALLDQVISKMKVTQISSMKLLRH